ncbi:hypothetical protein LX16_1537 [Stackebrandtia albiflava]|uniref:Uncharacterized protein n=2 Tax=Stackebrandtia albiflava TaxID=406432 RepID=A0A562VD57_9ACTN|nr:hypothetical protein LX16_1537 [Stackebrandtia albiflava]
MERRDLAVWLAIVAVGLAMAATGVAGGAALGTDAAPFLGVYHLVEANPTALAAPAVAVAVLAVARRRFAARLSWRRVLWLSYLASLAWQLALAVMPGTEGLTRYLTDQDGYRPQLTGIGSPADLLAAVSDPANPLSTGMTGRPPGSVLSLWAVTSLPLPDAALGALWAAMAATVVPLTLLAARSTCGPVAARRLAPLLILAPWAIWLTVGPDAVTAVLAAAALAAAAHASHRRRHGWSATIWAVASGLLLASATMFAYLAAWFGLSIVCLYFARRRPWHNLATGLGALIPLGLVQLAGFDWATGLTVAYHGFLERIEFNRSVLWWIPLSLLVLILVCGPPIVSSARKMRNTPAWPFLVGSAAAVVFSVVMGTARGGVEQTWLPLFPWLMIAATAPARPGGPPLPFPWMPAAATAATGLVIQAVLVPPW